MPPAAASAEPTVSAVSMLCVDSFMWTSYADRRVLVSATRAGGNRPAIRREEAVSAAESRNDEELLAECTVETFRAGGPGGQHQNKTESAVRLTHGPTGIVVTARESRSQHRNRARALDRLRAALRERARTPRPRRPTKPTRASREQRLEEKRRRSLTKRQRRRPESDE